VRLKQCKDFETYRQFFLDFVDHIVYYKNLVELHGYVPIRSLDNDGQQVETKIEYKINTEIEWAERMAKYLKKTNGTRISMMDFNSTVGRSKRMMKDVRLFSSNKNSN
jgi:hypothetical protein